MNLISEIKAIGISLAVMVLVFISLSYVSRSYVSSLTTEAVVMEISGPVVYIFGRTTYGAATGIGEVFFACDANAFYADTTCLVLREFIGTKTHAQISRVRLVFGEYVLLRSVSAINQPDKVIWSRNEQEWISRVKTHRRGYMLSSSITIGIIVFFVISFFNRRVRKDMAK
jgi:hypothetical protein